MSDGTFDLAGGDFAGAGGAQRHALRAFGVHAERQLLDVQHDVDDVFADAFQRRELVHHAVDLHGGDGRALQRGQQHAAQRVAERHAEAALERLGHQTRPCAARSEPCSITGFFGTDQLVPVSFDHTRSSNGVSPASALSQAPRTGEKRQSVA